MNYLYADQNGKTSFTFTLKALNILLVTTFVTLKNI